MYNHYQQCTLCPRKCAINRQLVKGFCQQTDMLKLALAAIHFGEEPPLVGSNGSGTLFFSGCQLSCPFCQNHQISRGSVGRSISITELADIMLTLQNEGACNINLVSATQHLPHILLSIKLAKDRALRIPIIYNTGGYEEISTLNHIKNAISIYLPDLKTLNTQTASKLYLAKDYPKKAIDSILYMVKHLPLVWDGSLLKQGVIVRHLVLPGYINESYEVLKWFSLHLKDKALLSIMTQYTPVKIDGEKRIIPDRYLNSQEEEKLIAMLHEFDINDGFFQDLVPGSEWLPNFNQSSPFQPKLARTIWHA